MSFHSIHFRKTHDVTELMDILIDQGFSIPDILTEIRILTPFAVEYRYADIFFEDEESLDRIGVREIILKLRGWVEKFITG